MKKTTGRPTLSQARKDRLMAMIESLIVDQFDGNAASLARALDISPASLHAIRRRGGGSMDTVTKVCALAGVSPLEFVDVQPTVAEAEDSARRFVELVDRYPNGVDAARTALKEGVRKQAVTNVLGALKAESDPSFSRWLAEFNAEDARLAHAEKAPIAAEIASDEKAERDAAKVDEAAAAFSFGAKKP